LAAAFLTAPVMAQQADQRDRTPASPTAAPPRSVSPDRQHIAGVIIKTENERSETGVAPAANTAASPRSGAIRLTINSAAVWRDWSRDQVGQSPSASPRADAERGAKSVATTGEPRSQQTVVEVDVDAGARIETLFRNVDGAAAPDAKTPAPARPAGDSAAPLRRSASTQFAAGDLKPGLFVEIDFRAAVGRNRATTVAVIRPTGGPETRTAQPSDTTSSGRPRD
jgi:hypothetical protein